VILIGDVGVEGVNLTEHDSFERVHGAAEKSPAPPLDHETIPVGEDPPTVAVHDVGYRPTGIDDGWHVTEMVVAAALVAKEALPELGR